MLDINNIVIEPFSKPFTEVLAELQAKVDMLTTTGVTDAETYEQALNLEQQIRHSKSAVTKALNEHLSPVRNYIRLAEIHAKQMNDSLHELAQSVAIMSRMLDEETIRTNNLLGIERIHRLQDIGIKADRHGVIVGGRIYTLGEINHMTSAEYLALERAAKVHIAVNTPF